MDFSRIELDWPHVIGAIICSAVIVAVWAWGCINKGWGQ